ncbi:hypothetical protein [Actinacidiphila sp. ITFR-21]|uniref:hypothetical protein n=1 Tax=Actinacidiphila sp. ITFR-21 TaxID=3075199 RepID=UPI00288BE304|nr:hypothetical protein [Streptomyces sp. ITFR-21]WNI20355.1 hypothetical protein RLT57_32650 [Streptomyces sp. ITFR-21]
MLYDDTETSTSDYAPCTGVTLTPVGADGLPDHDRATTHTFDPPITLAYALQDEHMPPLVGLTAAADHPDPAALDRLGRDFRQLDTLAVVEIRTPQQDEDAPDLFMLFVRWQPAAEDSWPETDPDAPSVLLAVGNALPATTSHPWPGLDGLVQVGNTALLFRYVEAPADQGAA